MKSVRAITGAWDPARPTEGAYSALLAFEDGAFASMTYSGYGHFDSDELCGGIGETGFAKDPARHGAARRVLAALAEGGEAQAKAARNYGGASYADSTEIAPWHEHFGLLVISCERGDVRPTPSGVIVYGDDAVRLESLDKPAIPRAEVIDELARAILDGAAPLHDGEWGLATLEVCIAMLASAREAREVALARQCQVRGIIHR